MTRRGAATARGGAALRPWPHATSWPAGAQGSSAASTARTVSQVSPDVGGRPVGQRQLGDGARGQRADAAACPRRPPRPPPRAPTRSAGARGRGSVNRFSIRTVDPTLICTGSKTFLSSSRPGEGVRSGNTRPSATKFDVVQRLAEVAAVREEAARGIPEAVVDPLPHEAALAARVALEERLVVGQAARSVAHRVRVLAEQERHPAPARVQRRIVERGLLTAPDRVDLLVRGVHARVDVDVAAGPVVLVVQRPRRIARARPRRHRAQARAPSRSRCRATTCTTHGWFLSRSTMRRMRSTSASSHAGSSDGLPRHSSAMKPCVSRSHSSIT